MPYGTINLVHGVPQGETAVTCTSGVGTFIVEFGTLSRLTGEPIFEETALKALHALWKCRSGIGLVTIEFFSCCCWWPHFLLTENVINISLRIGLNNAY